MSVFDMRSPNTDEDIRDKMTGYHWFSDERIVSKDVREIKYQFYKNKNTKNNIPETFDAFCFGNIVKNNNKKKKIPVQKFKNVSIPTYN